MSDTPGFVRATLRYSPAFGTRSRSARSARGRAASPLVPIDGIKTDVVALYERVRAATEAEKARDRRLQNVDLQAEFQRFLKKQIEKKTRPRTMFGRVAARKTRPVASGELIVAREEAVTGSRGATAWAARSGAHRLGTNALDGAFVDGLEEVGSGEHAAFDLEAVEGVVEVEEHDLAGLGVERMLQEELRGVPNFETGKLNELLLADRTTLDDEDLGGESLHGKSHLYCFRQKSPRIAHGRLTVPSQFCHKVSRRATWTEMALALPMPYRDDARRRSRGMYAQGDLDLRWACLDGRARSSGTSRAKKTAQSP